MIELFRLILHIMASFFKPRAKLVAEILILRQSDDGNLAGLRYEQWKAVFMEQRGPRFHRDCL